MCLIVVLNESNDVWAVWQVQVTEPSEEPAVLRELVAPVTDGEIRAQLDLQRTDN
jgi:hypothetical protein